MGRASAQVELLSRLIRERRSIRHFQDRPVRFDKIAGLLETALWAPSPHNAQPWRFTYVATEAKDLLAEAMGARLRADLVQGGMAPAAASAQASRSVRRIASAPSGLLASVVDDGLKMTGIEHLDRLELQMAIQSTGAVLQTFLLLAAQEGFGACWMAAPMYCPDAVRDALRLPERYQPQALILLGYAAMQGRVRPRLEIGEVLGRR